MNSTLGIALMAAMPVALLAVGSGAAYVRTRTRTALVQLLGAGCLVVVVLVHASEGLGLFPWMGWGRPDTVGHYLDLASAVLGLTLFPIGFLGQALTRN